MKNTVDIIKNKCTACRACEQICPKKAITMEENKEGFLYPKIDESKCSNCGLCLKRCHTSHGKFNKNIESKFLAVKPNDSTVAYKSTSGGLAQILSEYIINNNGYVYGSCMDENLYVKHIGVNTVENLQQLRGSKYVASDTLNTYVEVKEKLEKDITVLYIGTACQIAGLKSFLNKDYKNLYTVDIVCHGTPSYKLFKKYIEYLENKFEEKILKYEFRNKEKTDWGMGFTAKAVTNNSIKYLKADFDPYYINFLNGNTYRESCYECKYADIAKRPADLTIADYWGIEKFKPEFYDKNGVSLCIVNTQKGNDFLNQIKDFIEAIETEKEQAIYFNKNLIKPTERPEVRDAIYVGINELNPEKYIKSKLKVDKSITVIVKHLLPKKVRLIYKRFFKR